MSGPSKRLRLLRPSEISELIVHTDSDEARMSSDIGSVQGDSESISGVSQPQPYHQTAIFMSLAVQFHPVPLMKRMLVRVGQVNRLNS